MVYDREQRGGGGGGYENTAPSGRYQTRSKCVPLSWEIAIKQMHAFFVANVRSKQMQHASIFKSHSVVLAMSAQDV